ncbi:MAG: hypothetical protein ABI197_07675 [Granulicella sp.]
MVTRLMMAPVVLTLLTGLSSMAHAQSENSTFSARTEEPRADENNHRLGSPIEGSWIFNVNAPGPGITFHSVISFTAGGVVISSASLPGPSSPFYGSWTHVGPNSFQAVFYAFVPDAAGVGVATRKLSLKLQLTRRNDLVGKAVASECDLQGENCVPVVEFENTGKRIIPE